MTDWGLRLVGVRAGARRWRCSAGGAGWALRDQPRLCRHRPRTTQEGRAPVVGMGTTAVPSGKSLLSRSCTLAASWMRKICRSAFPCSIRPSNCLVLSGWGGRRWSSPWLKFAEPLARQLGGRQAVVHPELVQFVEDRPAFADAALVPRVEAGCVANLRRPVGHR